MSWQAFGDWGTSHLRLYRMESGEVTARSAGPGIGSLTQTPDAVLRVALAELGEDAPSDIHLCGMAGSRTGLAATPYATCPADAVVWARAAIRADFGGSPLTIAAGLACGDAEGQPDVMRGEEAQIFGAMALSPERTQGKAVYLLPGTHSKWALVVGGRIMAFRTFLSGELFALLASGSTLLALNDTGTQDEEEAGFSAGLQRAVDGGGLAATLFSTRSLQLRGGHSRRWARGFLSGLIIGDEVETMRRLAALPDTVWLIGAPALCARYEKALTQAGMASERLCGEACVIKGMELLHVAR